MLIDVDNPNRDNYDFLIKSLFTTITNASWSNGYFTSLIKEALNRRLEIRNQFLSKYREETGHDFIEELHDCATWETDETMFMEKAKDIGILSTENEDVRSLREFLIIGLKGVSAYAEHAATLGYRDNEIYDFITTALASTTEKLSTEKMVSLIVKCGETAYKAMYLLDKANTETYGNPEITNVNIGVGDRPGILISGHDLKDMEELLEQTKGMGIDVYTHSEMLPANAYPAFKKFDHFIGNYGGSWWHQNEEFEKFNGPILMTTNCLVPLRKNNTYIHRLFTTNIVSYDDAIHINDRENGKAKDFSPIIDVAKQCKPPESLEEGNIVCGFARNQVLSLADKVIEAVKNGKIKRFIVMAGCDGRHKTRDYYTEVAGKLPKDTVILTAGCAKYRYNKLSLGEIDGIPRVLDAGQCNDSYSLIIITKALQEAFGFDDINDLPVSYDIAWYEQKAVAVLLALLYSGIKGIRLGPTLPGFLSDNVAKIVVDAFDIKSIDSPDGDIEAMMAGK